MDEYLGAKVKLPVQGDVLCGHVLKRARSSDSGVTVTKKINPLLDTRKYQVRFSDGQVSEYSANVIAESMYTQCDPSGKEYLLMEAIVDNSSDARAIQHADHFILVKMKLQLWRTTA